MNRNHLTDTRAPYVTDTKPTPTRWPELLTFDEVCLYLGCSDVHGRRLGLPAQLERAGCALLLPGSVKRKWRKSKVDEWLDALQQGEAA